MEEDTQQITFKKLLISTLVAQVAQINNLSISEQVQASKSLKNTIDQLHF